MTSPSATIRLRKDYMRIMKDPVPFVSAAPHPSNILEWHYVVEGPPGTPYEGGFYHGKLNFPNDFPFKPPSIYMLTPNGRFQTNTRLCLSMSDFHPDTWNPAWTVSTILTGLLSFMLETSPTYGSIQTSDYEKRCFARRSAECNLKNKSFRDLFPEITKRLKEQVESGDGSHSSSREGAGANGGGNNPEPSLSRSLMDFSLSNILVLVGVACIAFAVKYVLKSVG